MPVQTIQHVYYVYEEIVYGMNSRLDHATVDLTVNAYAYPRTNIGNTCVM